MHINLSWTIIAFLLLACASCKEETSLSDEDILIQAPWQMQKLQIIWKDGDTVLQDQTGPITGMVVFEPDYEIITTQPGNDPVTEPWLLTDRSLQVGEEVFSIITLTEDQLVMEKTLEMTHPDEPDGGLVNVTERLTLIR